MISERLSHLRIVLVNPSEPGNIGAVARAMKTMCLQRLYLVAPARFPHIKASVRAGHALDVLGEAVVCDTLATAIADCHIVLGSSIRQRTLAWAVLNPREAAEQVMRVAKSVEIALVFGRERSGMTNAELQMCHYQVIIPANPSYSSLNLAAAVQVVCYELHMAAMQTVSRPIATSTELATVTQLEHCYQHLQQVLYVTEFVKPQRSGRIMERLCRLLNRAQPSATEVKILRGILTAIQKKWRSD